MSAFDFLPDLADIPLLDAFSDAGAHASDGEAHGLEMYEPPQHGLELPEPTQHGLELPEPTQHGLELPEPTQHGLELPDAETLPTFSQTLGGDNGFSGQSASGTASVGGGGFFDWLLGPSEKPLKAKKGLADFDAEKFLPKEMREKLEAERKFTKDTLESDSDRDSNRDGYRKSAFRIGHDYAEDAPELDSDKEVKLDTEEDRLAALDQFTQNYQRADGLSVGGDNSPGDNRCGATTLIAGAMMAEGNAGVAAMINMVNADEATDEHSRKFLEDINAKIAAGDALTQDDLTMVQAGVHGHLLRENDRSGFESTGGVDGAVLKDKLENNPRLAEMFGGDNMSVGFIDNDGDDTANHFVLRMGATEGRGEKVYDPLARKDGQLIDTEGGLSDYNLAKHHVFAP